MLRHSLPTFASLVLVGTSALTASPSTAQMSVPESIAALDSIAASPVIEGRVAGLAVAVIHGGDTLLMKSYGRADLEWNVPMTTDAVFEIGSLTKQFTAAAILKLRDEGKLDLDADLTDYLPEFPTQGHQIPVRRLLDHTSGIQGSGAFESVQGQDVTRDTGIALIAAQPFQFSPGEALIYNNQAYFLLGHIIQNVSGQSYENYIEEELFAELGMTRSSYCSATEVVERRAHGYRMTPEGLIRRPYVSHLWPFSAGSLCSTVGDLATWLRLLHGGGVLSESSYERMITPVPLNDGTPVRYAMGLMVAPDVAGRSVIRHAGSIAGFVSDARYYPEEDLLVVTLINTRGGFAPALFSEALVDVLLPSIQLQNRRFTGDVEALVGIYSGPSRGSDLTITVTIAEDGLRARLTGEDNSAPLIWDDEWTFRLGPEGRAMQGGTGILIFERDKGEDQATLLRFDVGTSQSVLRRQRD